MKNNKIIMMLSTIVIVFGSINPSYAQPSQIQSLTTNLRQEIRECLQDSNQCGTALPVNNIPQSQPISIERAISKGLKIEIHGTGSFASVRVTLINPTQAGITIHVPVGTEFHSGTAGFQNMVIR